METEIVMCFRCREPLSYEEQNSERYVINQYCPYCFESGR
jgi:predicted sulfurtransferase